VISLENFTKLRFRIYYVFSIFNCYIFLIYYFIFTHKGKNRLAGNSRSIFCSIRQRNLFRRLSVDGWSRKSFACGFDNPDRYARLRIDFRNVPHPPTMYIHKTHTHTHIYIYIYIYVDSHCRSTWPIPCKLTLSTREYRAAAWRVI